MKGIYSSTNFYYVLGVLNIGDGWISHYHPNHNEHRAIHIIGCVSKDFDLIEEFSRCINSVWGKNPKIEKRLPKSPKWAIRYIATLHSKPIVEFLLSLAPLEYYRDISAQIVPSVYDAPLECQRAYLQAFFDGQGSVDIKRRVIRASKKQIAVLEYIRKMLAGFGLSSYVTRGKNPTIKIQPGYTKIFEQAIGFRCKRKAEALKIIPATFQRHPILTAENITQMNTLLATGLPKSEIARRMGVSRGCVTKRVTRNQL